jgi:ATP-dependent DNA ligase
MVEAMKHLKVRSCLIDGEIVCCDEGAVAAFHVLRRRNANATSWLSAACRLAFSHVAL